MRGADILVRALKAAGVERLFTLSGNQIMSVFDACIDSGIELVHVRHEAAAVHMADAWGRLTDEPGVALVTAGPGFANTLSALYVARMAESPMVLLSGDAPIGLAGRGSFQEMAQTDMSDPVTKASWTARDASRLGYNVARALSVSSSGRPGPVHISLPVDLLESSVEDGGGIVPPDDAFQHPTPDIDDSAAETVLDALAAARRPLVLTGPLMSRGAGRQAASELARQTGVPVIPMESPRGVNDPSLGAFAEVLPQADLVLLLGRRLDFGLQLGAALGPDCRIIHLDPDADAIEQTRRALGDGSRLVGAETADPVPAAQRLARLAGGAKRPSTGWRDEVQSAVSYRPPEWREVESRPGGLHPVEVGRAVQQVLDRADEAVFISDGGEFGQWAQACISAPTRLINGPAGSIGTSIPFALAARARSPEATVVTMLGDGTMGFHLSEFDTAVRYGLPFVAVVGNDAAWNAEYQIQLREYGEDRLRGCELLPSRYDEVVRALGGHGEYVAAASGLGPALERAVASGLPACVNVAIGRHAAPVIRRRG